MLTYGVVADGSLRIAHAKGEVKDRYWNPGGVFDAVHVVVLADDDLPPALVQRVAGDAHLELHPVGRPQPHTLLRLREEVQRVFARVRPDVIRGHGPFLQGYYAVHAARSLGLPCFVSIHDDVSIYRRFWTYGKGYARITAYQVLLKALGWERYVYRHADRLVPKYLAAGRLLARSPYRDKVEVIYNQVHLERFGDLQPRLQPGERLRIISVGRQFAGKDQRPLIEALSGIDAELTLVGTGPLRPKLVRAARRCGVTDRVRFIDAVPNHELPALYAGHHAFAMNILQPGISMTVMEAMALGFPVILNRPRWEPLPEVAGEAARVVEGTAEGFRAAFAGLLSDHEQVAVLGRRSRQAILPYSGERMELQEKELILSLLDRTGAWPGIRSGRATGETSPAEPRHG
ncbi:MAG: glycosyltransferase [Candidatus Latescibacterota bacterium]